MYINSYINCCVKACLLFVKAWLLFEQYIFYIIIFTVFYDVLLSCQWGKIEYNAT